MNLKTILTSQFHAALKMLQHAILQCPDALWNDPNDKNKFWHVVYHVLFYTHLYLHPSEAKFSPWSGLRAGYNSLGALPSPTHEKPQTLEPYTKEEILRFFDLVWKAVPELIRDTDLDSEDSGFYWLPFGKLELQLYNLRHVQQHTGELMERLGRQVKLEVEWVGRGST